MLILFFIHRLVYDLKNLIQILIILFLAHIVSFFEIIFIFLFLTPEFLVINCHIYCFILTFFYIMLVHSMMNCSLDFTQTHLFISLILTRFLISLESSNWLRKSIIPFS